MPAFMPSNIVVIRHSGLTVVQPERVLASLDAGRQRLPRTDYEINTLQFKDAVDAGDWTGQVSYLRDRVTSIHSSVEGAADPETHYFGIAEIPHVLALGALLGDESHIKIHEYDRDRNEWTWPSDTRTLDVEIIGSPSGEPVTSRGLAICRVAISAEISEADVRAVVGNEALADVTIRLVNGQARIAKVRSDADLQHIREKVREAVAILHNLRPNIETVHLFVAAPVSVCFAIGQEFKPRNFAPFQTYRFRNIPSQNRYQPAILVGEGIEEAVGRRLSPEDIEIAKHIRLVLWPQAIRDVENYVRDVFTAAHRTDPWYNVLSPSSILKKVVPFPALPGLATLPTGGSVDPAPKVGNFRYDKDRHAWELPDQLLANFGAILPGNDESLRMIIRLFLFHEYVHDCQTVTAYTVDEIGKFANCLEYIDYVADSYALIHEFDFGARQARISQGSAQLASLIELLIRSFWAFEVVGNGHWEVRRLRRYLNWYWRHVQIKEATSLHGCFQLLARPPKVELAGLLQSARGRRVYCNLDKTDPTTHLEIGMVLEDESLFRLAHSPNINIPELLMAFKEGKHDAICECFRAIYELSRQTRGSQPRVPFDRWSFEGLRERFSSVTEWSKRFRAT